MRYVTQSSSARYPPKVSSTSHPVFLSKILPVASNASCPVFFSTTLVQENKQWIVSIWQCFPSVRSATNGSETRISQNKGMHRESDICSYNEYAAKFMQVPRTRKNSWYASDNLTGYASEGKPVGDARIDKS